MSSPWSVRTEIPDAHAFLELFETTGWNDSYQLSAEHCSTALDGSWAVATVEFEGRLIGTGRIVSDGAVYGAIFDLIVHPSWQGQGVGLAILDHLLNLCDDADLRDVVLMAAVGTKEFYEKRDFSPRPGDAPGMVRRRRRPPSA